MRLLPLAVMVGIVLAAPSVNAQNAAKDGVVLRTQLDPDHVMVGQQARLLVDVLYPGEMPHPPRIVVPPVEGVQIFRFESQATNLNERIGAQSYSGQRFEFDLYARRPGGLQIAPPQVTLLDAAGDDVATLAGQDVVLHAAVPPGLDAAQPIVAADAVSLVESWQPTTSDFRPGGALTRTITRRAEGIPGLAFLDLTVTAPDGVRTYPDPPAMTDTVNRGAVIGTRIDRITYVFERAGRFNLPMVAQPWWNLRSRTVGTLSPPIHSVTVLDAIKAQGADRRRNLRLVLIVASGAVVLAAVTCFLRWQWACYNRPTARSYRALRDACRRGDAAEVYRTWQEWLRAGGAVHADAPFAQSVALLNASLFGGAPGWNHRAAGEFLLRLGHARKRARWVRTRHSPLPPLNPGD